MMINEPILVEILTRVRTDIDFDSFDEDEYEEKFGFSKTDVMSMFDLLKFPERVKLNDGRHSFRVGGQMSFLFMLYRYHSSPQRLTIATNEFGGYDYSTLSKIFDASVDFMDSTHGFRLCTLAEMVDLFPLWNEKIVAKLRSQLPEGEALPEEAENCCVFVDGSRWRVSRPLGPFWRQWSTFSGDKWFHCHGAQGVFAPNGMFYHWFDGPAGKENDKFFIRESKLNYVLAMCQVGQAIQYWAYADKGYGHDTHVRSAFKRADFNKIIRNLIMGRSRVSIEWGFRKINRVCPLLKAVDKMKIQHVAVSKRVRVAALLTNLHTCLHGSQTGLYFDCRQPTLQQYLA